MKKIGENEKTFIKNTNIKPSFLFFIHWKII